MTEFNLSFKRRMDFNRNNLVCDYYSYAEEDVKEFIKRLKEETNIMKKMISEEKQHRVIEIIEKKIDKLAGKDLVEKSKLSGGKDE